MPIPVAHTADKNTLHMEVHFKNNVKPTASCQRALTRSTLDSSQIRNPSSKGVVGNIVVPDSANSQQNVAITFQRYIPFIITVARQGEGNSHDTIFNRAPGIYHLVAGVNSGSRSSESIPVRRTTVKYAMITFRKLMHTIIASPQVPSHIEDFSVRNIMVT